jgi:glyoxylase-like metal-dependent hydrolase (beta-lactamase superfamily II)
MSGGETYTIHAVRYAWRNGRRSENFLGGDEHDGPMPLDYFVWVLRSEARTILVDTGFSAEAARKRGRTYFRSPKDGLKLLGVAAEDLHDVVITHMHWDHAGTLVDFPNARFHLQDREMGFATSRHMGRAPMRVAFDVEDVVEMVRLVYAERVAFHNGDDEIAPNVSLHRIGGHTDGLQCVRVWTERGWVVLASDAAHFYANMNEVRPFPIVFHVGDMIEGYATMRRLAESPDHIIPGHDPLVMQLYRTDDPALDGIAIRLDRAPLPVPEPA